MTLYINGRFRVRHKITGVERYATEVLSRLPTDEIKIVTPQKSFIGVKGHLWEQLTLPRLVGRRLLWSPANTGPLLVRNQVVSIMDMSSLEHPEWFSTNFAQWYQFLLPKLVSRVQKILTISEYSRDCIVELCQVDSQKVVVTHLAVDQRFFRQLEKGVKKTQAMLALPTGDYLLALGSLEPRKNLGRLLNAWALAQPYLPKDLWLVLAGAKGKSLVFQDVSFNSLPPRVHLTGYVPDEHLPALYSGATAFLYPSLYEGFGLPPLEAMACGTPVIVSNTTSLPEVVGNAGLYVNPLDVESIADAIKKIVSDQNLREILSRKGLERSKLFSWDKAAALTWKVLLEAAEYNNG